VTEADAVTALEQELHPPQAQAAAELRAIRTEVKASDRIAVLRAAGLHWDQKTRGALLVIRRHGRTFDFWPSTGKWRERDNAMCRERIAFNRTSRRNGQGTDTLIAAIAEGPRTGERAC